jgi:hypothetical protein
MLGSTSGVRLTSGSTRAAFSAHTANGTLVIRLRRAIARVRVTLSYPALRVAARHPNAAGGGELTVVVTDAARGSSRIRAHA